MILAVSTSSPWVSIATIEKGKVIQTARREAPRAASAATLAMIQECGIRLELLEGFVADIGPGSFTGVRVGVVLVKTFGWALGKPVAGVVAADLLPGGAAHVIPNKRGESFVWNDGKVQCVPESEVPEGAIGYGPTQSQPEYPNAANLRVESLKWLDAHLLIPEYIVGPSISQPKVPYA